jgi:diguanylate cyclase (GGDEF)-like protein
MSSDHRERSGARIRPIGGGIASTAFGRAAAVAASLLFGAVILAGDAWSGNDVVFTLLYLAPVSIATWSAGLRAGLAVGAFCALAGLALDAAALEPGVTLARCWNAFAELGVFTTVSLLLSALQTRVRYAEALARSDTLTGLANRRAFVEALWREWDRTGRTGRAFTLAYLDLDGFKQVNDRLGHAEGDRVLCAAAEILRTRHRRLDLAARLGGDEFALLLPETDAAGARELIESLQVGLMAAVSIERWGVTVSVGTLTVLPGAPEPHELLVRADALMYDCKRAGRNGVRFAQVGGKRGETVAC